MKPTQIGLGYIACLLTFSPELTHGASVTLQNATATFSQTSFGGFPVSQTIDGDFSSSSGWSVANDSGSDAQPATAVFESVTDVGGIGGTLLTFTLSQLHNNPQHTLGRFRLAITTDVRSDFADGLSSGGDVTANWNVLQPISAIATGGALLTVQGDMSLLASGPSPNTSIYTIVAQTALTGITGFRLEALEDASLPSNGPGRRLENGNFCLVEFQVDAMAVPEPSGLVLATAIILGFVSHRRG